MASLRSPWLLGCAGRDYVHQVALLNLQTCQLLTVLLRTCPRTIGAQAAQVGTPVLGLVARCPEGYGVAPVPRATKPLPALGGQRGLCLCVSCHGVKQMQGGGLLKGLQVVRDI